MNDVLHRLRFRVAAKLCVVCAFLSALLAGGCSDADGRRTIEGNVTLDGAPVASGSIRFEPVAGAASEAGAAIVDGKYHVPGEHGLTPGTYRVSISSPKSDGGPAKPSMDDEAPPAEELIPARYNTESELEIKVEPSGLAEFDFDLTTDGS